LQQLILQRSLKVIEQIYDDSMYGSTDIFRIKDIIHSLDPNQWKCKMWLADTLKIHYSFAEGKIVILGGWYGLTAYLLRQVFPSDRMHIVSVDCDPRCEEFGYKMFFDQNIEFVTQDVREQFDFSDVSMMVSTSVEHFDKDDLIALIRSKNPHAWVALQTNNMFDHPSHINCSNTLDEFIEYVNPHLTTKEVSMSGQLNLERYKRMMVIGL
jgi:hypothetical protein